MKTQVNKLSMIACFALIFFVYNCHSWTKIASPEFCKEKLERIDEAFMEKNFHEMTEYLLEYLENNKKSLVYLDEKSLELAKNKDQFVYLKYISMDRKGLEPMLKYKDRFILSFGRDGNCGHYGCVYPSSQRKWSCDYYPFDK